MGRSNFQIQKPGAGAAIYTGIHDAQNAAQNSESRVAIGATSIISSVAVAGFALASTTAASGALAAVSTAMAVAVVPSAIVFGTLYATGSISDSTFQNASSLLDSIVSPEGLATLAGSLAAGKTFSDAQAYSKNATAIRGGFESILGILNPKSISDGYSIASGIGGALDAMNGSSSPKDSKTKEDSKTPPTSKYKSREVGVDRDRAMSQAERVMERRQAASERQQRESTKPDKVQDKRDTSPQKMDRPGRGETQKKDKSKGTNEGGGIKFPLG